MDDKVIRAKVKCCSCEGSLLDSSRVNMILLMKEAEWQHPCWGNILLGVWGFASAVVCEKCLREKKEPKFAVEWNKDLSIVKYHPVEQLKDVPEEIFKPLAWLEPELEPYRHKIAG